MFPSEASASGQLESVQHFNARIGEAGGAKFWFHALRNCFITVADRELILPTSLTKPLVNHARSQDLIRKATEQTMYVLVYLRSSIVLCVTACIYSRKN